MLHGLTHLLGVLGPWLVFGLVFLESMGLPFPGETVLLTGAAFAAGGRLSIVAVAAAAALGGTGGGLAGYAIGRGGILGWLRRRGAAHGRVAGSLSRAHDFFQRHGGKSLLVGRFVTIVRSYVFIAAGTAGMRLLPFVVWDAVGAVLWSGAYAALGYEFGQNLPRLEHALGAAGLALAGGIALAIVLAVLIRWVWANEERIAHGAAAAWARHVQPAVRRFAAAHPRAVRFAPARLSPAGYLALHLVLGMSVATLALWLFGAVLEGMVAGRALAQFDLGVAARLHQAALPGWVAFFRAISVLGYATTWTALSLLLLLALLVRRRWLPAGGWAAAMVGAVLLDIALELLVHRPRPVIAYGYPHAPGLSFPGHYSLPALIGYGMLAFLLLPHLRHLTARIIVAAGTALLILLIGFGQLYLGVHYFSDIVAGYGAGIVWLSACITGLEVARHEQAFDRPAGTGASS